MFKHNVGTHTFFLDLAFSFRREMKKMMRTGTMKETWNMGEMRKIDQKMLLQSQMRQTMGLALNRRDNEWHNSNVTAWIFGDRKGHFNSNCK